MDHESFSQRVKQLVDKIDCEDARQKVSLECFYYAILQVAQEGGLVIKACKLRLDSELSIGAGTGSSASFSVCLVAAFLRWQQLQNYTGIPSKFSPQDLAKISQYAYNCEKIMHGKPSGIDNSICTFGSLIEFRKGELPNFIPMGSSSLRILLVDTQVARNTKLLVDKVAGLVEKYPRVFHPVLDSFDSLSLRVVEIVKQLQNLTDADENTLNEIYNELSVLIDINQGLLTTCQVSHPCLDMICIIAKKYGFSAKLTGAGGGGFAYVLVPPKSAVETLSAELAQNGFLVTETNLGGYGVQIHDVKD